MSRAATAPESSQTQDHGDASFAVRLDNFEGPFDLLLSLIAKHKLDVTEVALSQVTDEFIAHLKAGDGIQDLEQTTSFLVVASTLLDLKAARLLPQGDVEDEEDLALLEARDLLFARLLQYKAYKQVAAVLEERIGAEARRHPRAVGLDERYASLLPEVLIGLGLQEFAALAARALEPKPVPELSLAHIHAPTVSVKEQAAVVVDRLRRHGTMSFRSLAADAPDVLTRVARFLALLELFREGVVGFDQITPLGELSIRWTGTADGEVEITDEFDGPPPQEPEPEPADPTLAEEGAPADRTLAEDPTLAAEGVPADPTLAEERVPADPTLAAEGAPADRTLAEERASASVSKPDAASDEDEDLQ